MKLSEIWAASIYSNVLTAWDVLSKSTVAFSGDRRVNVILNDLRNTNRYFYLSSYFLGLYFIIDNENLKNILKDLLLIKWLGEERDTSHSSEACYFNKYHCISFIIVKNQPKKIHIKYKNNVTQKHIYCERDIPVFPKNFSWQDILNIFPKKIKVDLDECIEKFGWELLDNHYQEFYIKQNGFTIAWFGFEENVSYLNAQLLDWTFHIPIYIENK